MMLFEIIRVEKEVSENKEKPHLKGDERFMFETTVINIDHVVEISLDHDMREEYTNNRDKFDQDVVDKLKSDDLLFSLVEKSTGDMVTVVGSPHDVFRSQSRIAVPK